MELQKMKYKHDGRTFTLVCAINSVQSGGEYTLCGNAIPDTTMKDNDCEHIGDSYRGSLKNVTCGTTKTVKNIITRSLIRTLTVKHYPFQFYLRKTIHE